MDATEARKLSIISSINKIEKEIKSAAEEGYLCVAVTKPKPEIKSFIISHFKEKGFSINDDETLSSISISWNNPNR